MDVHRHIMRAVPRTRSLERRSPPISIKANPPDRCAPSRPKHREYDAQFNSQPSPPSDRVTLCGRSVKSQATAIIFLSANKFNRKNARRRLLNFPREARLALSCLAIVLSRPRTAPHANNRETRLFSGEIAAGSSNGDTPAQPMCREYLNPRGDVAYDESVAP